MCCEPIRTASGQTHWVVMEVQVSYIVSWFLQHSASIPKHQHRDEHRLSHRKEQCTLGKKTKRWVVSEEVEECFVFFHPSLSQLAQDAGSSMSYMRIRGVSETFHHRPFVSQPCRTLGASRGSWRLPVQRQVLETSTHLCFQPSVWNSAIWWALDAQARLIIWFRQNFFLPMFQNFYTIFLI